MSLFLAGVAFLAAFVLICLGAIRVLQSVIQGQVEGRFRAAEAITNDHRVPTTWLQQSRIKPGAGPKAEARAKALCLKKLDALIGYFRGCPFVDSEESRELLLEELGAVRETWQRCTWAGILAWDSDRAS